MLADARLTVVALAAVASSREMPNWPTYRALVEAARVAPVEAPRAQALRDAIGAAHVTATAAPSRVVAALVSFTDDHDEPLPHEMLPRDETLALIERIASASTQLSLAAQLGLAMSVTADPWRALLACHLATRQLARGRDVRALGRGAPTEVVDRCRIGARVAAFPHALSEGGDPLGDTYHYWANVIAGVTARQYGWRGRSVGRLFHAGPYLMRAVREGMFGSRLFYGDHRRVDHLGLAHGLELGG